MSKFGLCCNSCLSAVDGIAYRTRCGHLFCPTCAKAAFQRSNICSICSLQQRDVDVNEIKVGILMSDEMLQGILFQYLLQNTCWENIEDKLNKLNEESRATANFVVTQLIISASMNAREKNKLELDLGAQADQLAHLNQKVIQCEHNKENIILTYEAQLRDTNKALMELQEAYKEKLRKCQAWEKAYNNIRGHLVGTNKSELTISSRDAAMLESEAMHRASTASSGAPRSRDDSFLHQEHPHKNLRTDITTFRNVTTHRLPAHMLQQGPGPGAAFSSPYANIRSGSTFLGNNSINGNPLRVSTGAGSGAIVSVPSRPHSLSPLASAGNPYSEPRQYLQQYQEQFRSPQEMVPVHSAVRAPSGEGTSVLARYAQAPVPVSVPAYAAESHYNNSASVIGKRSFFDGEN